MRDTLEISTDSRDEIRIYLLFQHFSALFLKYFIGDISTRKGIVQMLILCPNLLKFQELLPKLRLWQCGTHVEFFLADRVDKNQVKRMKIDASIRIGLGKAILYISPDRTAHGCELHPNLMWAT